MKRKGSHLKEWVFGGIVFLMLLILIFTGVEGKKQDSDNLADYAKFQKAEVCYSQGDFDQAYPIYEELAQKFEYSVAINWGLAQILKDRSDYGEAVEYYNKIWKKYPGIVQNQTFLEEYVGALSLAGDKRAELYQRIE